MKDTCKSEPAWCKGTIQLPIELKNKLEGFENIFKKEKEAWEIVDFLVSYYEGIEELRIDLIAREKGKYDPL